MLLKEAGYDEYLANQIKLGREDIQQGKVYTLEQTKAKIYQTLEHKALELEQSEREHMLYG